MSRAWLAWAVGLALAAIAPGALGQALQRVPTLEARVTDLTGTLTAAEQAQLEQRLAEFEARKGAQLAVLIVPTTQPEEIEQYGIRVAEAWKLGREKPDDGALLLVAKNDRRLRIEVGRGLEGALTDLVSRRIIDETIAPLFRQGDFAGGISAGVDRMISVIDGEPLPEPDPQWNRDARSGSGELLPFLLLLVIVGSTVLHAFLGRALGSAALGGFAGFVGYSFTQAIAAGIGIGLLAFFASLLFGAVTGGRWSNRPTRRGGWHAGGWGAGGFGGGGFGGGGLGGGGFGGGGGSFGGGGA